ncbi:hypothetical protein NPIL_258811, partial [Nephila pilipes]
MAKVAGCYTHTRVATSIYKVMLHATVINIVVVGWWLLLVAIHSHILVAGYYM